MFAFTVSFHIILPAFTIGLAAWLATLEGLSLATVRTLYRRLFDFWLKVFAVAFGLGVVSGLVMTFQSCWFRICSSLHIRSVGSNAASRQPSASLPADPLPSWDVGSRKSP